MQPVWRNFAPMYIQGLSHSHLFAGDTVFVSGDAPLSARDPQPLHWHDAYEFGFVMSGTGSIVLGEREYPFVPGQVYIINGAPLSCHTSGRMARFCRSITPRPLSCARSWRTYEQR